jgi:cyclopropane-fatty-acyl-phospholipid synthase
MSIVVAATKAFEALPLPDAMSRLAIRALVTNGARTASTLSSDATEVFARAMQSRPIATDTAIANRQHYEVPADFFELVLGPQRKYSCCYFEHDTTTLAAAEERALEVTAQHANLSDGQHVLELGCGWGSLTLWMARHFPGARIVAVSNSAAQRVTIERNLQHLGVTNVKVITADMNNFDAREKFDRVVSVEMFEHMSNWQALLQRIRGWLTDEGRAFLHVFAHRTTPYAFDVTNKSDWIA